MPVLAGGDVTCRDDDGSADRRAAAALAGFASGEGSEQAGLARLAGSRLLVPVVAAVSEPKGLKAPGRRGVDTARNAPAPGGSTQGGEKGSEMSLPTLVGRDGRRAIPAFTCLDALARWRPDARPVPAVADLVWRAAVADSCAVLVDIAGPVPLAIACARLAAPAHRPPVPPPHQDPDPLRAVRAAAPRPG